ncbi:MAG: hypothetical protein K2J29_09180, partial [Muribaculaceae bacterium]|nr:hypothetical protein [Muribaculaceae bacterium]
LFVTANLASFSLPVLLFILYMNDKMFLCSRTVDSALCFPLLRNLFRKGILNIANGGKYGFKCLLLRYEASEISGICRSGGVRGVHT